MKQVLRRLANRPVRLIRKIVGTEALRAELSALETKLGAVLAIDDGPMIRRLESLEATIELSLQDMLILLDRISPVANKNEFSLSTAHPIAVRSDDHRHPRGTRNDNTRCPRFVRKCEYIFERKIRALDLGCAGGGLVLDFLLAGHSSLGLEGSDYSLKWQRAEWRFLRDRLFTCDITEPYSIIDNGAGKPAKFDLISAWEVLEHLPEDRLEPFFANIRNHLADNGLLTASVATFEDFDKDTGAIYHVTVKPRDWWQARLQQAGLEVAEGLFETRARFNSAT